MISTLLTSIISLWLLILSARVIALRGVSFLKFSNTTPLPAKIYANEGAAQFLFFKGDNVCDLSYADRKGKYMFQEGVTLPKL